MFNPLPKRMKFSTKNVLVLTVVSGESSREAHRASPSFVFYVDTDGEKLAFIDWFLTSLERDEFDGSMPFTGHVAHRPAKTTSVNVSGHAEYSHTSMLYFEANYCKYKKDERVFPIGTDGDKLALFELVVTGELDTIFGMQGYFGFRFRMVKARFPMDADKAAESLGAKLPTEIAEQIVEEATSDTTFDTTVVRVIGLGSFAVPTARLRHVRAALLVIL